MHARTLTLLAIYAIAMALLESAVVVYLRYLHYPDNPLDVFPLLFLDSFDAVVELSREVATVIMIICVALMAERSSRARQFAAFVFVFGVWDIFYYAWLKVLLGWPRSWLEWDVLFLIPIVWLGPWICPALISLLFIVWGGWVLLSTSDVRFTAGSLTVFAVGAALGLVSFIQPATGVLMADGVQGLSVYMPGKFWWWMFLAGFLLMAYGLGRLLPKKLEKVS